MRIDPASSTPVFEQIASSIRSAIAAGIYRPGELIPSIRQQATTLLTNPNTIKHAYDQLEREGIIATRKGLGMAVTDRAVTICKASIEHSLKATFGQAIRLGQASEMPRSRIDEAYRKAWAENASGDGSTR